MTEDQLEQEALRADHGAGIETVGEDVAGHVCSRSLSRGGAPRGVRGGPPPTLAGAVARVAGCGGP